MSSTYLFKTMHNHTNRNRRLSPLYRRNLLTRKISLDKDIFETVSKASPEICRQQRKNLNTSCEIEDDFFFNNETSLSANQIHVDLLSSSPNNVQSTPEQVQMTHNITFRKSNFNNKNSVARKSAFDSISSRISEGSQKRDTVVLDSSEVREVVSDNKERLCPVNPTLNESGKRVSHINSKQSIYVLFPSKRDAIRVEDMKIFIGSDFNLKSKHILDKILPQTPQTRQSSSISKFHSANAKDFIKRRSTFHKITKRFHASDEWNEYGVIEKLNNLWIHGTKVSFKMLLQQGPLGVSSSSTIAKVFSTLINLKKSHFINIFKNNEGEIEFITRGPALWRGIPFRPYSV